MTHRLTPAEALALLLQHADFQSPQGPDRAMTIAACIPGEVLAQCRQALEADELAADPDDEYLIWSHEHSGWWAPGECGYTRAFQAAGVYSRAKALHICQQAGWTITDAPPEVPVRRADVAGLVPVQRGRA